MKPVTVMEAREAMEAVDSPESKLLFWMSHKGIVRKAALHRAVAAVRSDLEEKRRATYVNTIRRRLLELGHAQALDDAANEWQVLPPYLSLLPPSSADSADQEALLCGGRTPAFLDQVATAADALGLPIAVQCPESLGMPPRIGVTGAPSTLRELANRLNIPGVDFAAQRMIENAKKTDWQFAQLQQSSPEAAPTRSQYKCWSWREQQWQADERDRDTFGGTVGDLLRVEVGYGPKPHLVRYRRQWCRILSETQAQFISARLQDVALASYNESEHRLRLRLRPPYFLARPLCLCSGLPPQRNTSETGRVNYDFENVSPAVAREWGKAYGVRFEASGSQADTEDGIASGVETDLR